MLLNWYLFSLRRTSGRLRFRQLLVVWYYRGTQAGPTKLSCQATFQAALLLDSREINCGVSSLSSISMRGFAELRLDYFAFFSSVSCRSSSLMVDCMWRTQTHTHTQFEKNIHFWDSAKDLFIISDFGNCQYELFGVNTSSWVELKRMYWRLKKGGSVIARHAPGRPREYNSRSV